MEKVMKIMSVSLNPNDEPRFFLKDGDSYVSFNSYNQLINPKKFEVEYIFFEYGKEVFRTNEIPKFYTKSEDGGLCKTHFGHQIVKSSNMSVIYNKLHFRGLQVKPVNDGEGNISSFKVYFWAYDEEKKDAYRWNFYDHDIVIIDDTNGNGGMARYHIYSVDGNKDFKLPKPYHNESDALDWNPHTEISEGKEELVPGRFERYKLDDEQEKLVQEYEEICKKMKDAKIKIFKDYDTYGSYAFNMKCGGKINYTFDCPYEDAPEGEEFVELSWNHSREIDDCVVSVGGCDYTFFLTIPSDKKED